MSTALPMLAAISGESLMWLVIEVLVAGLIYWLLTWAIAQIGPPEPFAKIAKFILVVAVCVFLINALLGLAGHPIIVFR